jgi:hypothetical protein
VVPAALLALGLLVSCQKPLTEGDVVAPQLASRPHWVAGRPGELEVRLVARLADGSKRALDLGSADPVAAVTFYRGDEPLGPPATVALSHRC